MALGGGTEVVLGWDGVRVVLGGIGVALWRKEVTSSAVRIATRSDTYGWYPCTSNAWIESNH